VARVLLPWVSVLALGGFLLLALDRSRSLANKLLLLVPIAAGLVNYWVQRKYFEYHLMVAVPGVIALACVALGEASRRFRSGPKPIRAAAGLAMLVAVSGTAVKVWRLSDPVLRYRTGRMDRTEYYGRFRPFQIDYGRLLLLSERLAREVPEQGTVLVWGRRTRSTTSRAGRSRRAFITGSRSRTPRLRFRWRTSGTAGSSRI
jgi:hypothetical protein